MILPQTSEYRAWLVVRPHLSYTTPLPEYVRVQEVVETNNNYDQNQYIGYTHSGVERGSEKYFEKYERKKYNKIRPVSSAVKTRENIEDNDEEHDCLCS